MNKIQVAFIMIFLSSRVVAHGIAGGQTVGYSGEELKRGNNRVEINFDSVNPLFSTLDMIFKADPPEGVVGDEMSFPLDGKVRRYRFDSYDGTNYILKVVGGQRTTTLDAFPWMPVVWIDHKSDNSVRIVQAGVVDGKYVKLLDPPKVSHPSSAPIKVTLVDKDDPDKRVPIQLKGGHIRLNE